MPIRNTLFTGDCNDIKDLGWYRIDNASHSPNIGHESWLLCLPHSNNNFGSQWIFARGSEHKIFQREIDNGVWGSWYYIDLKVVQ